MPQVLRRTYSLKEAASFPGAVEPEGLTLPEPAPAHAPLAAVLGAGAVFVCAALLGHFCA